MPITELSCDQVELASLLDTDRKFGVFPHVTVLDSSSSDNSTLPVVDNLKEQAEKENSLDISESDYIDSLPLLEFTPLIINDMSTPDVSRLDLSEDINEDDEQESSNILGNHSADFGQALLSAGYQKSTIKAVINHCVDDHGGSRPKTHIFSQGRVYTYPKLEIGILGNLRNIERRKISLLRKGSSLSVPASLDPSKESSGSPDVQGDLDAATILKQIRISNLKNVIIGQLNVNSLRNKFYALLELIPGNVDILVITETKLDDTFPEKQFLISGYKKPYRLDRNISGGGVMIYVREDIPSERLTKHNLHENVEAIFVEINLRKNKILLVGTYHSTNVEYGTTDEVFFKQMTLALDVYSKYDKFLLAGDFNVNVFDSSDILEDFLDEFHALNLVKEPTCFKSHENPSCIDLFITNSYRSFQKTTTVATGLSDFHKMTVTVLKTTFPKVAPRVITYRDYSCDSEVDLENDLIRNLGIIEGGKYDPFEDMVKNTLQTYYQEKRRTVRANHKP